MRLSSWGQASGMAPLPRFSKHGLIARFSCIRGVWRPLLFSRAGGAKAKQCQNLRVGKNYLSVGGVDDNTIFIEEQSHTTLQSLRQAIPILNEHGLDTVLLVSHDFHMMRTKKMARDLGLTAYAAPVATKNKIKKLHYSLREVVVYWMYLLFRIYIALFFGLIFRLKDGILVLYQS